MPPGQPGLPQPALAVLACGWLLWEIRADQAGSAGFSGATALVLALTVLVVPMYAPYNQLLLLPAMLLFIRRRTFTSNSRAQRFGYMVGALAVTWQWIASFSLSAIYLLGPPAWALGRWRWPFFATFALPVLVFMLIFLDVQSWRRRVRH